MKIEKIMAMKEERAALTSQIRGILDEFDGKEMPGEKKDELRRLEERFDSTSENIMAEERQLERERILGEKQEEKRQEERKSDPDTEVRAAFSRYLANGTDAAYEEYRALSQASPTQAGYLVAPEQFVAELIKDVDNALFMRQLSRKFAVTKAQSLGFPKLTTRMGAAAWGTEISAPTADSTLAFGKREFKPNPLTAEILVSKTLVRNSAVSVDEIVRAELAYAFGTAQEQSFMTGNGVGQPLGIFTASNDGISTGRDVSTGNTTTAITFDGLKEAKYTLKQQYHNAAQWIFHRDAVKNLAKIKDGEGQYIWQQGVTAGESDTLLGFKVNMSEYAPNTFTSQLYVGMLGDFSNYWIVDSLDMELQALMELYARTNQVDYIGRMETDGMPVNENGFVRVKLA